MTFDYSRFLFRIVLLLLFCFHIINHGIDINNRQYNRVGLWLGSNECHFGTSIWIKYSYSILF